MKKLSLIVLFLGITIVGIEIGNASGITQDTRVIRDQVTPVNVALNAETVKCSIQGYDVARLKVIIPQLAGLTVLNHRNENEGGPCVAAGACRPFGGDVGPDTILAKGEGSDLVAIRVKLE